MQQDKQVEEQFKDYLEMAKRDKNVEATALMMNALKTQNESRVSAKAKKWAYLVSLCLPPFGLIFVVKYYLSSDKSDARRVANICLILTVVSLVLAWLTLQLLSASMGNNLDQLQKINPQDVQNLLQ